MSSDENWSLGEFCIVETSNVASSHFTRQTYFLSSADLPFVSKNAH